MKMIALALALVLATSLGVELASTDANADALTEKDLVVCRAQTQHHVCQYGEEASKQHDPFVEA